MAPEVFNFAQTPITSHSFNANRTGQYFHSFVSALRFLIKFSLILTQHLFNISRSRSELELQRCPDLCSPRSGMDPHGNLVRGTYFHPYHGGNLSEEYLQPISTTKSSHPSIGPRTPTASSLHRRTGTPTCGNRLQTQRRGNCSGSLP